MAIRCTLFGHAYAETEVEREREERGDEAVVTIREIQVCERCGDESVVSENKEVTSVAEPETEVRETSGPAHEPEPFDGPNVGEELDPSAQDPDTDDAVILDESDEVDEEAAEPEGRQYGEWPDAEEGHASAESDPVAADDADEPTPWPDADGDDEGYEADAPTGETDDGVAPGLAEVDAPPEEEQPDDGAELLDAGSDAPSEPDDESVGRAGGEPASGDASGSGIQREGDAPSPARPGSEATALYCPSCGYRDDSRDGSLRQGDICPECKKGYLGARD